MLETGTRQIKKIVFVQFAASLIVSLLIWIINPSLVLSVITGAMTASLTNAYFAWKVFSKQKEAKSNEILVTYYGAEVGKIILTVMLFVTIFSVIKPLNVAAMMGAYLFITLIPVFASFFFNDDDVDANRRKKNVE